MIHYEEASPVVEGKLSIVRFPAEPRNLEITLPVVLADVVQYEKRSLVFAFARNQVGQSLDQYSDWRLWGRSDLACCCFHYNDDRERTPRLK